MSTEINALSEQPLYPIQKLNVYVAAGFGDRAVARDIVRAVESHDGLYVTGDWMFRKVAMQPDPLPPLDSYDPEVLRNEAMDDLDSVDHADYILLYLGGGKSGGGKDFETGYAVGVGEKEIIAIGEPRNVFHYLDHFIFVEDLDAAIRELKRRQNVEADGWLE